MRDAAIRGSPGVLGADLAQSGAPDLGLEKVRSMKD